MSTISSRTPEGWDNHCPICKHTCRIEPSAESREAPCPNCGHLLWFTSWGVEQIFLAADFQLDHPEITKGTLPDDLTIAPAVLDMVTMQMAIEDCVLPIECTNGSVLIAMHDPTNVDIIDKLRFVLNKDIRILHVDQQSLRRRVAAYYGTGD